MEALRPSNCSSKSFIFMSSSLAVTKSLSVSVTLRDALEYVCSEEFIRTSNQAVLVFDDLYDIIFMNAAAESMFKFTAVELYRQKLTRLGISQEKIMEAIAKRNVSIDFLGIRQDASSFLASARCSSLSENNKSNFYDSSFNSAHMVTIEDVGNLRKMEEQYSIVSNIIDNCSEFMSCIEIDSGKFRLIFLNKKGRRMIFCPDNITDFTAADIHPPSDMEILKTQAVPAVLATGYWRGEINFKRFDNDELVITDATFFEMTLKDGSRAIGKVARDIRDSKRLERHRKRIETEKKKMEAIVNGSLDYMGIYNTNDGRIQFLNAAGMSMMGLSASVAEIPRYLADFHSAADVDSLRTVVTKAIDAKGVWKGELNFKNVETGEIIPTESTAFYVRYEDTTSEQSVAIVARDIRERRRLERRQQVAEKERAKIDAIVNGASDFMSIVAIDTNRVLYINKKGMEMVGLERNVNAAPQFVTDLHPPSTVQRFKEEIIPACMDLGRWTGEIDFRHTLTGDLIVTETSAFLIKLDSDTPAAIGKISRDIRERKRSDEKAALRNLIGNHTRECIVVCDSTMRDCPIVYANSAYWDLIGYSSVDKVGQNCRFLQGPGTDVETVVSIRDAIKRGENERTWEILNYRKDGSPFWNRLTIIGVRTPSGDVRYFVGVNKNVTEEREAAISLRASLARVSLLDNLPTPVCMIRQSKGVSNQGTHILYVNNCFWNIFCDGRPADSMLDQFLSGVAGDGSPSISRLEDIFETSVSRVFEDLKAKVGTLSQPLRYVMKSDGKIAHFRFAVSCLGDSVTLAGIRSEICKEVFCLTIYFTTEETNAVNTLAAERNSLDEKVSSLQNDLNTSKTKLDELKKSKKEMTTNVENLEKEVKAEMEKISSLVAELTAAKEKLSHIESRAPLDLALKIIPWALFGAYAMYRK